MNRIIREHYPASRLPDDLRGDLDPASTVTVTVVADEKPQEKAASLDQIFASRRPPFRAADEIDEQLRRQRDEWDG